MGLRSLGEGCSAAPPAARGAGAAPCPAPKPSVPARYRSWLGGCGVCFLGTFCFRFCILNSMFCPSLGENAALLNPALQQLGENWVSWAAIRPRWSCDGSTPRRSRQQPKAVPTAAALHRPALRSLPAPGPPLLLLRAPQSPSQPSAVSQHSVKGSQQSHQSSAIYLNPKAQICRFNFAGRQLPYFTVPAGRCAPLTRYGCL